MKKIHLKWLYSDDYQDLSKLSDWNTKLKFMPTKAEMETTIDSKIVPLWNSKHVMTCPSSAEILKSIGDNDGSWILSFAKSICSTDNGFSSGIIEIGDCLWFENAQGVDGIIILTKVWITIFM